MAETKLTYQEVGNDFLPVGTIVPFGGITAPSGWIFCDGRSFQKTDYPSLFSALTKVVDAAVTITIASPGTLTTATNHGFRTGDMITLDSTGTLPTGLTKWSNYYVIPNGGTGLWLASSLANALANTKINFTGSQTGTHTLYHNPYGNFGNGVQFYVPDLRGRVLAGRDEVISTINSNRMSAAGVPGNALGAVGGVDTHTLAIGEIPAHTHTLPAYATPGNGQHYAAAAGSIITGAGDASNSAGGGGAHNNLQPSIVVNYIIKAV